MKLHEIKGLFNMDSGAPSPIITSNDNEFCVCFYIDNGDDNNLDICILKFPHYLIYIFGMPSNETLHGHFYNKLGIESYAFYELIDSDLIKQLKDMDKCHPYYHSEKWKEYHHYIITFHDNMFECVAKSYSIKKSNASKYNEVKNILGIL